VQLGLRLLLYRPLQIQCYISEVRCVQLRMCYYARMLMLILHLRGKGGIKYRLACGALRNPAGQLTYM